MKIEWSEQAVNRAAEVLTYLEENHSIRSAQKFHLKLWEAVSKAGKYPTTGSPSLKVEGIRSLKIDKYRRLFYMVISTVDIVIIDIFDTRQNPEKLTY